ncbi:MAG: hypothetical protein IRY97_09355 [Thermomicrobiaceae bacterium]|nr:hypothetical protein [Thermomicrobiaceae bacterium]
MRDRNGDESLHELLLEIDRLEEIREDMEELGLRTLEDVEARLEELHRLVDEIEAREGREE